jgi:hypothetical protein
MMMSDPFLQHFEQHVLPRVAQSSVIVVILTDGLDSKLCLELGAAVLLDKPIIVLTCALTLVSERLGRIADKVVVIGDRGTWKSDQARARIEQAIDDILRARKNTPGAPEETR